MSELTAPFPYFGGKSSIADVVWQALGQPKHYIEPFFGSGAVLLRRPEYDPTTHIESVCDKDGFLSNVWRSIQYSPDETAKWCDWPVNHADLMARRRVLLANEARLLDNLVADDVWHDPKLAGYWIWAASCWIGSGLTSPTAIPHLADGGTGVHKLSLCGKRPQLAHGGKGVHKQEFRTDEHADSLSVPYRPALFAMFRTLAERLRNVRVVCGDWTRVCGGNWQDKIGLCGMFFDPPYGVTDRDTDIYHHDSTTIARDVEAWCLPRGQLDSYRIVVAGYAGEYPALEASGWRVHAWKAGGGYGSLGNTTGKQNAHRERLWLSPHCISAQSSHSQQSLL